MYIYRPPLRLDALRGLEDGPGAHELQLLICIYIYVYVYIYIYI